MGFCDRVLPTVVGSRKTLPGTQDSQPPLEEFPLFPTTTHFQKISFQRFSSKSKTGYLPVKMVSKAIIFSTSLIFKSLFITTRIMLLIHLALVLFFFSSNMTFQTDIFQYFKGCLTINHHY